MATFDLSTLVPSGKIKQVIGANLLTGDVTNSASSYADSGHFIDITPTSATSIILIQCSFKLKTNNTGQTSTAINGPKFQVVRTIDPDGSPSATNLTNDNAGSINDIGNGSWQITYRSQSWRFSDRPNTTSPIEYKIQFLKGFASGTNATYFASANEYFPSIVAWEVGV